MRTSYKNVCCMAIITKIKLSYVCIHRKYLLIYATFGYIVCNRCLYMSRLFL